MTNAIDLLIDSLANRGVTGLISPCGCSCWFSHSTYCERPESDCVAAYVVLCDGSAGCDYCNACDGEEVVCSVPSDWIDGAEIKK